MPASEVSDDSDLDVRIDPFPSQPIHFLPSRRTSSLTLTASKLMVRTSTQSLVWLTLTDCIYVGIGAADVTKLKAHGYFTVAVLALHHTSLHFAVEMSYWFDFFSQSVHGATRRTLLKIKGFSEIKVEKIKEAIQKCLVRVYSTLVKTFRKIADSYLCWS